MISPGSRRAARYAGMRLAIMTMIDRGDRGLDIVPDGPLHDKRVGLKNAGEREGNLADAVGHAGAEDPADNRANDEHDDRLPDEDERDVAPGVSHRAQDGDFLGFLHDDHRQGVEHRQAGDEREHRDRDPGGKAQRVENLEPGFFRVPARARRYGRALFSIWMASSGARSLS